MLRSLWFITKLALIVAAAVWVAEHPGTFTVEWLDYTITAHIGVVLIGLMLIIAVASYTGRIFAYLTRLPEKIGRYRYIKGSREGVRHLTHGYAALAGGDMSSADKYAQKAGKKLPDDFHRGLIYSLQAQIAKEKGDEHKRRQILARMAEMDDVAIFGLRGILQDKIEKGDFDGAQKFVDHYLPKFRKKPWLMKYRYALALERDDWDSAQSLLEDRSMPKVMDKSDIQRQLIAILVLQAEKHLAENDTHLAVGRLKRVLRLDKLFIPAVTRLAALYLDMDKTSAARALLDRTWRKDPHPDLIHLWDRVHSKRKRKSAATRINWFKKLVEKNPHAAEGYLALAQVAMEEEQWGETREALERAEEIAPTRKVYYHWADFEDKVNGDRLAINAYLRKAAEAPPDKAWVCTRTGQLYKRWRPIAPPHNSFNTIIWTKPFDNLNETIETKALLTGDAA